MSLLELINDPEIRIARIASYLDDLDPTTRARQVAGLGRDDQRLLFEKAAEAPAIDLAHFVGDAPPRREIVHEGTNTLPLPRPLRRFQKRFCRGDNGAAELYGYNEGPTRRVVGPGYFVAHATAGRPHWEARGAVVIDYYRVPESEVAGGWPDVVPNTAGLQRFVYHLTRDFMRRVSAHVSVGAAFKRERPLDHYFVLCRRE